MTVSESTKNDLVLWGIPKQNITVIHNGVTAPSIIPKKEKKKTIIYLGALTKDKGIETALEVFKNLQDQLGNIQFWVIGRGNNRYQGFLKAKVATLGIKNIKFWGYLDDAEKFRLLSRSRLLVNPSVKEGWGIVVIEAATMGVPTVAFNVPGLRDSIINDKTGLLSDDFTAQALTDKAMQLLEDGKKMKQMSINAIFWSKKFSWEKSTRLSLKLINKML